MRFNLVPEVKMKDPPDRIVADQHVTLTCVASGMPPPNLVRWEKDRVPLHPMGWMTSSSRISISSFFLFSPLDFGLQSFSNSITLRDVTSRTSGHYTCVYKNREGYGSDTKEVYVQSKRKKPHHNHVENLNPCPVPSTSTDCTGPPKH